MTFLDEHDVKNMVWIATDVHHVESTRYAFDGNHDGKSMVFHEFLVGLNARVHIIQAQLKSAAAFFEEIQGHVHGNGMNPGVKRGFAAEPANRFVSFGENVLQKVVRVLVVGRHVVDQPVEPWRIFDHEIIERAGIACLRALYQLLVWVASWLIHRLALRLNTRLQTRRQQIGNAASR